METITFLDLLADLYPALNATGAADLVHWTDAELFAFGDEAVADIAKRLGVFVEHTAPAAVSAVVALPARHVSTLGVACDGRYLEPASVHEIEALDDDWMETTGTPARFCFDPLGALRLHPAPSAPVTLDWLYHEYPATVQAGQPLVRAPLVLRDLWFWRVLAAARAKESDAAMPEVAAHFRERSSLLERLFADYWGTAQ